MIGRIVAAADFERVLAQRPCARSAHFSLHHLPESAPQPDLSTEQVPMATAAVDECPPAGLRLGCVLPKRHARRAVTRNLIRRQIRAAAAVQASGRLAAGGWVVRLKAPFEMALAGPAASTALRRAARAELDALFRAAPQRR